MSQQHTPPRLAQRLLERAVFPDQDGRSILGDLHEEFLDLSERSPTQAAVWYWKEALLLSVTMVILGRAKAQRQAAQGRSQPARLTAHLDSWQRDFKFGIRRAVRRPAFSLVAVGSLAVGVGACALIYSVIDATLIRSRSGIVEPSRIVEVWRVEEDSNPDTLSYPDARDLEQALVPSTFSNLALFQWDVVSVNDGGGAQRLTAMYTTANYLDVLGVAPALGQAFSPAWDTEGPAMPVVILSHRFWRSTAPSTRDLTNQTVRIAGRDHLVLGVLSPQFKGHTFAVQPDVLLPLGQHATMQGAQSMVTERSNTGLWSIARLADDASVDDANTRVGAVFDRLAVDHPNSNQGRSGQVFPYGPVPGGARSAIKGFLSVLMALVLLVLLITCANVAGMLLASATSRGREMAVRVAVGSSRTELIRQLICESLLLFAAGGLLGTLIASTGVRLLTAAQIAALPIRLDLDVSLDWRIVGLTLGATATAAIAFGFLPAWHTSQQASGSKLRSGAATERLWMRRMLVVGQVTASLVLMITAGLFLKSVSAMAKTPTGFDPSHVVTASVDLELDGLASETVATQALLNSLEERLSAIPGVESAAFATDMPLDLGTNGHTVEPEGWTDSESSFEASYNQVSAQYLDALGVELFEGRSLSASDGPAAEPVAMVNREFAQRAWPGESAIGRWVEVDDRSSVLTPSGDGGGRPGVTRLRVVGVVDNVKSGALNEAPRATLLRPISQTSAAKAHVFVRFSGSQQRATETLRTAILETHRDLSHTLVLDLKDATAIGSVPQRVAAWIASGLGGVALLLSALGLYGVISFTVANRAREIGVRLALGARQSKVVAGVLKDAALLAVPGLALGLVLGLAAARAAQSFLIGVAPWDWITIVGAVTTVSFVLLAASFIPAKKAATVDPALTLRSD